jgi:hypothetical protein
MTDKKKKIEQRNKILLGLERTWEKLVLFKKEKKSDLVILKDDKVVHVKPV